MILVRTALRILDPVPDTDIHITVQRSITREITAGIPRVICFLKSKKASSLGMKRVGKEAEGYRQRDEMRANRNKSKQIVCHLNADL